MPHWCGADVDGEIAGVGPDVTGWQVGQRVVVDPGISLSEDEHTRRGVDSVSPDYHVLGEHMRGGAAEHLDVMGLLWSGKLKPVIHCVMPLGDRRQAYEMMEAGRQFGKILLINSLHKPPALFNFRSIATITC